MCTESNHNDTILGFPIDIFPTVPSLVKSLKALVSSPDTFIQGDHPYQFLTFPIAELDSRLILEPFVPTGNRGSFEIFSETNQPVYLIWRFNHKDLDAISLINFIEKLRSSILDNHERFSTLRELISSRLLAARSEEWIDTVGDPVALPLNNISPRQYSAKFASALAVSTIRNTKKIHLTIGFLKASRGKDEPISPGNKLKVGVSRILVDVVEAYLRPHTEIERLANAIMRDLDDKKLHKNSAAEAVDILVNVQTLDWYSIICGQTSAQGTSFGRPFVYHQFSINRSQIRTDVELWNRNSPVVRNRTVKPSPTQQKIFDDARSLLSGTVEEAHLIYGGSQSFPSISDVVDIRLESLRDDPQASEYVNEFASLLASVPERYTIGLSAKAGGTSYLEALACLRQQRIFHFVGESNDASPLTVQHSANELSSPVAWMHEEGISYFDPTDKVHRDVGKDGRNGIAYILSSGSTGRSKVTLLTKAMAENIIGNAQVFLQISPASRLLMVASPRFDAIYFEILIALHMKVVPTRVDSISRNLSLVKEKLESRVFTHLVATPTILTLLNQIGSLFPKIVMSVGEKISDSLLYSLTKTEVKDLYGPSEAGIWSGIRDPLASEAGFKPLRNVYFRKSPTRSIQDSRASVDFRIGLASSIYGEEFFEVDSGDAASFDVNNNYITDIRRTDGLVKISGKRFSKLQIGDRLKELYGFTPTVIEEVGAAHCSGSRQQLVAITNVPEGTGERLEKTILYEGAQISLIYVNKFPVGNAGKLDVPLLLQYVNRRFLKFKFHVEGSTLPPSQENSTESWVRETWTKFFPSADVGKQFSELGGTSLDALRIQAELVNIGLNAPLVDPDQSVADYVIAVSRATR
ncbi:non-ribosomal peptide synthase [Corynebacterium casei]|uniref:AMP-binding protein n=1 Tax=Corynebacterium casei TaxID=160386 RepID=UPI0009CC13AE|nr:AMP-binding protein [Corynebacterium casei]SLM93161.1 non-ribosomal peptide synthase [Corynebacterium casei]